MMVMKVGRSKEMNVKTIKILCGMLTMLAFTACSSDNDERADAPRFYNVTLTASMGDAETRALSVDGNVITASFAENDEVVVVDADGSTIVGTLKAQSAGESTTLSGTLDAKTLEVNEVVKLRYRSATANYDGQVGTLDGIAVNQDYEEGTLTVTSTNPLTFNSNSVTLLAKQSITKFTFKNGTNPVSVKSFGIAAVGLVQSIATNGTETAGAVTGTLGTASSDVYVALRNNTDAKQTYAFTIKDNAGNWYITTKKAKLTYGKNYAVDIALTPLPALTSSDAVGTIGVVGGLPAIVVTISETKKAVALMNVGALCPEAYGTYYIFDDRASGLSNDWYVPSQAELSSFKGTYTSTWGAPHGVNGRTFTIGSNTLFLPAAGLDDTDNDPSDFYNVSTFGYYWSSDDPGEGLPICLSFSSEVVNIISGYKTDALPVRPFHALN